MTKTTTDTQSGQAIEDTRAMIFDATKAADLNLQATVAQAIFSLNVTLDYLLADHDVSFANGGAL